MFALFVTFVTRIKNAVDLTELVAAALGADLPSETTGGSDDLADIRWGATPEVIASDSSNHDSSSQSLLSSSASGSTLSDLANLKAKLEGGKK